MRKLDQWIEQIKSHEIIEKESLDLSTIWTEESSILWKAKKAFNPSPFYPVYQYKEYYSFAVLPLILLKQKFVPDQVFFDKHNTKKKYYSGLRTVDEEIRRVSGAFENVQKIQSTHELISRVSQAMIKDAARTESIYPNHDNIIFCGGKDSLNILLLPWKTPIIVASAPPNFSLVKQFIEDNNIQVKELVELTEEDSYFQEIEVLSNACLNNLTHCRWINHFMSLSSRYPKSIFWKGQLGDTFLTENWKAYRAKKKSRFEFLMNLNRKHRRFIKSLWERGAMWQGAHMSNLRLATGKLVLSIYQGPEMTRVLQEMDLTTSVDTDIREQIGREIAKRDVIYPTANPSPQKLNRDPELSSPTYFKQVFSMIG